PLLVDPFVQQGGKLTANDETGSADFGSTVALSSDGNTALVGGAGDHSQVGAAWVFTRTNGVWSQQGPKLTPNDEAGMGDFGARVAPSSDGKPALLGGYQDTTPAGRAWVFPRSGGAWTQQGGKLTANDETGKGVFGIDVALSADGNTALIGGYS